MLPLILISSEIDKTNQFIENYINENNILPFYIFRIFPEKEEIVIEQVRNIKKDLIIQMNNKRLFILENFDNSSYEVQNALLKTFEENTENNLFIVLAKNGERIIPTIRSRSKTVYLDKDTGKSHKPEIIKLLDEIIKNKSYSFFSDHVIQTNTKDDVLLIIDEIIYYFRNKLKDGSSANPIIIKKALELKELLRNNNLNPQLTLDNLLIFIVKEIRIKI